MKVGFYKTERILGQEVFISLKVSFDSTIFIQKQQLSETVDYALILESLDNLLRDKEIKLLESITVLVGNYFLKNFSLIKSIEVRVEKSIIPQGISKGASISVEDKFFR